MVPTHCTNVRSRRDSQHCFLGAYTFAARARSLMCNDKVRFDKERQCDWVMKSLAVGTGRLAGAGQAPSASPGTDPRQDALMKRTSSHKRFSEARKRLQPR